MRLQNDLNVEVFCPMMRFRRVRRSGKVWVTEAMFPGYLFGKFDYLEKGRLVATAPGVAKILKFGGAPVPVEDRIIAEISAHANGGQLVEIPEEFVPGEEVRLAGGVFEGVHVLVTRVLPARQRIVVLFQMLGMPREIEVGYDQVAARVSHPLKKPESVR